MQMDGAEGILAVRLKLRHHPLVRAGLTLMTCPLSIRCLSNIDNYDKG